MRDFPTRTRSRLFENGLKRRLGRKERRKEGRKVATFPKAFFSTRPPSTSSLSLSLSHSHTLPPYQRASDAQADQVTRICLPLAQGKALAQGLAKGECPITKIHRHCYKVKADILQRRKLKMRFNGIQNPSIKGITNVALNRSD